MASSTTLPLHDVNEDTAGRESEVLTHKSALQREGIEYDRRQIRRKVKAMVRERALQQWQGENNNTNNLMMNESSDDGDDENGLSFRDNISTTSSDEESVYEDTEIFPWKQREAAVRAAAMGGRTEGRMEGFDSLERALQAHQHKLHYGRGKGFAWSLQQKNKTRSSLLLQKQRSMAAMAMAGGNEWQSFRNLDADATLDLSSRGVRDSSTATELSPEALEAIQNRRDEIKKRKRTNVIHSMVLFVAICSVVGFAYYMTILKVDNYETYLPKGYSSDSGEPIAGEQHGSESQSGFQQAASQTAAAAAAVSTNPQMGRALHQDRPQQQQQQQQRVMTVSVVTAHDYTDEMERNRHAREMKKQREENGVVTIEELQQQHQQPPAGSRLDTMKQVLGRYSIFDTVASLYALQWIAREDLLRLNPPQTPLEEARLVQRFALATLYFATNGQQGWSLSGSVFFLQPKSVCEWHFQQRFGVIGCTPDGLVTHLNLSNNNLDGFIPKEISLLTELRELNLQSNVLKGFVPRAMENLKNLKTLHLEANQLNGSIDFLCSISALLQDMHADCGQEAISCTCCRTCCYVDSQGMYSCNDMDYAMA